MGLTWEVWGKAGGGDWKGASASVLGLLDLIRPKVSNQISRKCFFGFGKRVRFLPSPRALWARGGGWMKTGSR